MKYTFKLQLGDPHILYRDFVLKSNVSIEDFTAKFEAMDKVFKVSNECTDYDDSQLSHGFILRLEQKAIDPYKYIDKERYLDCECDKLPYCFLALIIDLMVYSYPDLKIKVVEYEKVDTYRLGYGLFSQ